MLYFLFTDSDVEIEVDNLYDSDEYDEEESNPLVPSGSMILPFQTYEDFSSNQKNTTPWRIVSGEETSRKIPIWKGSLPLAEIVREPIEYFKAFFDENIMQHIVDESNIFSVQKDSTKPLNLNIDELEQFIGTLFYMSMIKVSKVRLYWSARFNFNGISDIISRNRWENIKKFLHCNNNETAPPRNSPYYDPLYKVRPLLTHLQTKFTAIPKSQMLSVHKQIIPFRGVSAFEQYLSTKPKKSGFKIFALSDNTGMQYNFEICIGKTKSFLNEPDLGTSSNIVLRLIESVPQHENYLIHLDNWFTSIPLICTLAQKGIFTLGTVRLNRVKGINNKITNEKDLLKEGRGSHCELSSSIDGVELRMVRWADSNCINLISSFSSAHPLSTCSRYDKKQKQKVEITYPEIVKRHNEFMGGVDLIDSLVSLYRIHIRSHKFYHKIIYHLLDVSVINCWLLYRRDCESAQVPLKDVLPLQHFKLSIANSLVSAEKVPQNQQVNLSSYSVEHRQAVKKTRGHNTKPLPAIRVRMDGLHHWPNFHINQQRCKLPGCKFKTRWECTKCKLSLCLSSDRNCFIAFHNE